MIDFVGTSPFLRIALRFAVATMHFHIAQTRLFLGNIFFFRIKGVPGNSLAPNEKLSWCARKDKLDPWIKLIGSFRQALYFILY